MSNPFRLLAVVTNDKAVEMGRAVGTVVGFSIALLFCVGVPLCLVLSIVQYARTRKQGWLIALVVSAVLCLIPLGLIVTGFGMGAYRAIQDRKQETSPQPADRTVKSTDGALQLRMADHWRTLTDLNEEAVIQVGNPAREEYLIVLSEPKIDFEGGLEDYAATCRAAIQQNLGDERATELRKIRLNGHDAYQCEISGTLEKVKLEYCFTALASENDYHQIVAWTLFSKKDAAFRVFGEVIGTCELR